MNPGHGPAGGVGCLGPGLVPGEGGGGGAGDGLVLGDSPAGSRGGEVAGEDIPVHVLLLALRGADRKPAVQLIKCQFISVIMLCL